MPDEDILIRLSRARDKAEKFRRESVKWRTLCLEQRRHIGALEAKIKRLESGQ